VVGGATLKMMIMKQRSLIVFAHAASPVSSAVVFKTWRDYSHARVTKAIAEP
jgi:hypothetical protein